MLHCRLTRKCSCRGPKRFGRRGIALDGWAAAPQQVPAADLHIVRRHSKDSVKHEGSHFSPIQVAAMTTSGSSNAEEMAREVRVYIFKQAAETGRVPQTPELSAALHRSEPDVVSAVKQLAAGKVLILAPNDGNIWAANPFCAVPSGFRVEAGDKSYWGICIWDALGICAALGKDAVITAPCGDCGEPMRLEVRQGRLSHSEGIIHFAVPAHHWWDNIGFT